VTSQRRSTTSEQEIDMKVRALIGTGVIAVLGAGLVAPTAANAAAGSSSATITVANGLLSISVPDTSGGAVALTTSSNSLTGYTISGNLGSTSVTDNRNSTTGWTAYANSSAFAQTDPGGTGSIAATNVNIQVPASQVLTQAVGAVSITQGVGTQLFVPTAGVNGTGSGQGGSIGTATTNLATLVGSGLIANNAVTYNPKVTVTVPPNTPDGTYVGTITQTAL
jgi:hypothetical protein